MDALLQRSREVRASVVRMAHRAKSPHVGSALSSVDLLVALYFHVMDVDPARKALQNPDRFVLSKGHGCMAYYATLAARGFFGPELLETYSRNGSVLAEHPSPVGIPGCEIGTGSLGHGLSVAAGAALARKLRHQPGRQFVLLSDGECNEGSVWEAAMFASGRGLDNLVVLVDYNKLQAMGRSDEVTGLPPLAKKWSSFSFGTVEIDGHSMPEIVRALEAVPFEKGRPSAIIAHTVKGKGVSFMENDLEWHYRPPSDADLARALAEIGA
jgi:transketolase